MSWLAGCQFVAFDFDGTLTSYVQADTTALEQLRRLTVAAADPQRFLQRAIDEILAFHNRVERGEADPLTMDRVRLERTLAAFGQQWQPEYLPLYHQALVAATVPVEGARELLSELQERGIRLALLTNAYDGTVQRRRISACFPDQPFEVVIVAGETGALKPAPQPFWVMLEQLGLAATQGIYVGDSPTHDVAGAQAAGLRCLLVHPSPLIRERGQELGANWTAASLSEALEGLRVHLGA